MYLLFIYKSNLILYISNIVCVSLLHASIYVKKFVCTHLYIAYTHIRKMIGKLEIDVLEWQVA